MVRSALFVALVLTCFGAFASAFVQPPPVPKVDAVKVLPPKTKAEQVKSKAEQPESKRKEKQQSPLLKFMARKLKNSSSILEGLVTDDFKKIEDGAAELLKMSTAEKWRAHNDMAYLQHSREFQTAIKALQKKARDRSIDGAGLAYMNVTMSCIRCHEWVRNVIIADVK